MALWLQIYLWGCLAAFVNLIFVYRDKDGNINWLELIVSIIFSAFSWVIALALFVGLNIKHAEEQRKKKEEEEDKFFGDD